MDQVEKIKEMLAGLNGEELDDLAYHIDNLLSVIELGDYDEDNDGLGD